MRCLIQRVRHASVRVDETIVGQIEAGLLVLLGIGDGDDSATVTAMARKVAQLRIFTDADDRMNHALLDTGGGCLVVSQFTLYADTNRGRRPFFGGAAAPDVAAPLCLEFQAALRSLGVPRVEGGKFGANMQVELCNDGPVTIWLDSAQASR